ncbi:uncharacterized protein [Primulina eburnea]|uniref:uncharacterized protein n=1 Tax=Primulina eburnea TaxID=1245227 RepID=UPI003C6C3B1F
MVTERGIEANPEKVRAILDMVPPRGPNAKVNGKDSCAERFISRSAHRSLPFFRTLHKAKKFEWRSDCGKVFVEWKKYLAEIPVLAKPAAGEPLWVYLSAIEGAVSSVLVKLERSTQQPVYYVSHALKGAEIRYSGLEKFSMSLVMTARRLRPYFLSHPIVLLTNSPLAIKAQALAGFLAETVHQENEDPGKVYVDGSSSKDGSGAGVVLISPAGEEVKLVVRLDIRAPNNETEYEAVLAGLRAARNVGATRVLIFSDSQLVEQQMKGIYDVKDEKLIEYAQEVDKVREKFTEFTSSAWPLLRCLSYQEADYVLQEVHEGCCGNHLGAYLLSKKVMLAGYCWPSVMHDAQELVISCDSCQRHARFHHQPAMLMKTITAACPFNQWVIDIVGHFPIAPAQKKFLLVAVDYFSKCVEAEPLARITENGVLKFL